MKKLDLSKISIFILLVLIIPSNNPTGVLSTNDDIYYPEDDWRTSSLEDQGVDSKIISDMKDYMDNLGMVVDSILMIKNGYLVEESYYNTYNRETQHWVYSITKSIMSTLIGIAIQEGFISSVNVKVFDYFSDYEFENMNSTKASITLYHLLTMTSGLEWNEWYPSYSSSANDWNAVRETSDWIQYILDKPMVHQPGTAMEYSTGTSHILSAILTRATGISAEAFAIEYLFGPLGIENYYWEKGPLNYTVGGTWLSLRPIDLAKFGYLYLNNGTWDGIQIINEEWITNATKPKINFDGAWDYGFQWWVPKVNPTGAYVAWGWRGQRMFVIPERNLVAVLTGFDDISIAVYLKIFNQYIIPATSDVESDDTNSNGNGDGNFSLPGLIVAVGITAILRKRRVHSLIFNKRK